jgi:hypothetical protein
VQRNWKEIWLTLSPILIVSCQHLPLENLHKLAVKETKVMQLAQVRFLEYRAGERTDLGARSSQAGQFTVGIKRSRSQGWVAKKTISEVHDSKF